MPDIRVYFTKTGDLKYISHLDLQRAMARLLIRSGLPIVYTEGFNPHPRLNIALPLSVYQEGEREVMDFRLSEEVPPSTVCEKLNARMFPGSSIVGAEYLSGKNAPKSAVYRLELATDVPGSKFARAFEGEMKIIKRSKSGEKEVDIAPMVKLISVTPDEGGLTARMELPASGSDYLNPAYVAAYFGDSVKVRRIVRENIVF